MKQKIEIAKGIRQMTKIRLDYDLQKYSLEVRSPTGELLRVTPEGEVLLNGKVITDDDAAMAAALREVLSVVYKVQVRPASRTAVESGNLLPCPFCGQQPSESQYYDESLWSNEKAVWHRAYCSTCDIGMSQCESHDDLVSKWNRRSGDDNTTPNELRT